MLMRKINWFGGTINEDYGWEIALFHKLRDLSDGITFIEFEVNWDRYLADHKPQFRLFLAILNHTLIEASIYYLHHREGDDE